MPHWNIVGHEWAVALLARDIAASRVRHAYLFAGPPGIGKRTLATAFAQALNCLSPPGAADVCGACRACTLIAKGLHPDAPIVQAEGPGASLKIEQIRELQKQVSLAPYEARFRVPILLRFHEATHAAANALLKTLEEPPPQVILLLTADSPDSLLPTIVSRCEVLNLRPLPVEQVRDGLVSYWKVPAERATLLAHLSGGRSGWAVRLSQDEEALARREARLEDLAGLLSASRLSRFAYAEALAAEKDKSSLRETLALWLTWWRDVLLLSAQAEHAPLANVDRMNVLRRVAQDLTPVQARAAVEAIRRSQEALDQNANVRLTLEALMLDLPRQS